MQAFSLRIAVIIASVLLSLTGALAWHDETHLAVAKAAGYKKWYNSTGADIAKIKAGNIEQLNHRFNNNSWIEVTPQMVLGQIGRYNDPTDEPGHLYGAIIAALREYDKTTKAGKYPEYHIAFCAHYIGDLSEPLHNTPYNDFNRAHHVKNDGVVENEVMKNISMIEKNMYHITLRKENFENDLAREIARIANLARNLGVKMEKENRDMTKEEAYVQLGHSASLLKAVVKYLEDEAQSKGTSR